MPPAGDGTERYRIEFSSRISERIKQLHRTAESQGRGATFRDAIRALVERLQTDPLACGEPVYALRALGLTVRVVVRLPIILHFAAQPQRRIVWLTAIDLLS